MIEGIRLFADTADIHEMARLRDVVTGFTTNPTLMRRAGVTDYREWGRQVVGAFPSHCLSFEVLSDITPGIVREALDIASWGPRVYVKVPIVDTRGVSNVSTIQGLMDQGVKVNLTAVTYDTQLEGLVFGDTPAIVSVFAGRVADTGCDPFEVITDIRWHTGLSRDAKVDILWASTRQVYSVVEAVNAGCDIITVTPDLLDKLTKWWGMTLDDVTLATVRQFYDDIKLAGYTL